MASNLTDRIEFARTLAGREATATYERVTDRLADALLDLDDVLGLLDGYDARRLRPIEPTVRRAWNDINELMKQLCD